MEQAALLGVIAVLLIPGAIIAVELSGVSRRVRLTTVLILLASGMAAVWGIRSREVRWVSYYHRLAFGHALHGIQDGLDRGHSTEVRAALAANAGGGWYSTPSLVQIDALTEAIRRSLPEDPKRKIDR